MPGGEGDIPTTTSNTTDPPPGTTTGLGPAPVTVPGEVGIVTSPGMRQAIDRAVASVPVSARGQVETSITNQGAEVYLGWKPSSKLSFGGYAQKLWSRPGVTVGARATFTF